MDHAEIAYLRTHSRAWRLLRADTAPLVLAVLGRIFVVDNVRTISESDLVARVDDELYAINAALGGDPDDPVTDPRRGDPPAYPRAARDYVETWAAPEQGWLRKFYPAGSSEPHFDATSELEKAWAWVAALPTRSFVGTESRLHTLFDLLRQMVHGADTDPDSRLVELHRRRSELDEEIARAEAGEVRALDGTALRDRYQHFASTARELLADFREVEENFRALDRGAREQIATWNGSKGELLERLIGDRHAIAASEQGRSFQAFHDFLLSRSRQEELSELLERLVALEEVAADRRLRHVHHDWLEAAERTQQTVRQLSEQLRRFLDDKVWLENRRVMDLLRSIEQSALVARRHDTPAIRMELDGFSPELRLPMERPLYAPARTGSLESGPVADGDAEIDTSSLFEQVQVDTVRLAGQVRTLLRGRDQVRLEEVLERHPPAHGLAEVVAYLALSEDDLEVVFDETARTALPYTDTAGVDRVLHLPLVTLSRRHPTAAGGRR
ncbi:MAG TPA: DUF3375 domain-containing protein [Segeticoccus sp.]|uniref:DUF3375 domain-containing protein n=1 Tax=Segeticoccus sp. TaxID=2706531 RepID=UPI002D7FF7AD|nr:DUF3375 domain-containing protein [Segeticoccus sp.]HET8600502.1 DUF3375 domain-containing protein [Segeticoccus sp.]